MIEIKLKEIIKSSYASDNEQGDIVYKCIKSYIKDYDGIVCIDFAEISLITTAFLNNAIGKIFQEYNIEEIKKKIKFKNIADKQDLEMLRLVMVNSIEMNKAKHRNLL